MRVHRLRISAFGPFAGTEEVDLDALAGNGLFLLCGPTGAGKTTVLDAVCFALFGVVPGARTGVTRLRSDHAPEGTPPEVSCEFTASGRRLEVTRSPAWDRPKKRGAGTTLEQARVLVRELRDGAWQPMTSRIDEAALLLEDVLGLGPEQFTKLVLLPQGEFAAFLRADAEARRAMLERLFGTDRFAAVQQWLRERQQDLRREVEAAEATADVLVAQAEQAALGALGGRLPQAEPIPGAARPEQSGEDGDPAGTAPIAAGDVEDARDPAVRMTRLRRLVGIRAEEALTAVAATGNRLAHAAAEHRQGQELARCRAEYAGLVLRRDRLAAAAAEQEEQRRRLGDAARAATLVPLAGPVRSARARAEEARATVAEVELLALPLLAEDPDPARSADAAPVSDVPAGPAENLFDLLVEVEAEAEAGAQSDDGDVDGGAACTGDAVVARAVTRARRLVDELDQAEQDELRLSVLDADEERERTRAERARLRLAAAQEELEQAGARLTDLQARREAAAVAGAGRPAAVAALEAARGVAEAVAEAERLQEEAARLRRVAEGLRRARDEARERWLDLRERRLDGMAAELATHLVPGAPCPVCGGCEHPAPSVAAGEAVDAAEERAAAELAETGAREASEAVAALAAVVAAAAAAQRASQGRDRSGAARELEQARRALTALDAVDREREQLEELVVRAGRERDTAAAGVASAAAAVEAAGQALAAAAERADAVRRRVTAARGDEGGIGERRARARRRAEAGGQLLAARQALREAEQALAVATSAALEAACAAGFGDLEEALAAVLPAKAVAELEAAVRGHDEEAAAVADRLGDPHLVAAADARPVDLVALATTEELARADDERARRDLTRCEDAAQELAALDERLEAQLGTWRPLVERYRTLSELSRCLDGTGGENGRRMSLSAYVLAARLEQVAEAASLRLGSMSGGRYTLVHSDEAGRGRGRSGLALKVVDGWTGVSRDTATLSGGESFYTSLALALGLADVVAAEAGGTTIETLFVDEGFGTLDDETLEDVMDVLDGLRAGGRAVGLVSHVADLRQRIPARLEVVKTRTGSTLRQAIA